MQRCDDRRQWWKIHQAKERYDTKEAGLSENRYGHRWRSVFRWCRKSRKWYSVERWSDKVSCGCASGKRFGVESATSLWLLRQGVPSVSEPDPSPENSYRWTAIQVWTVRAVVQHFVQPAASRSQHPRHPGTDSCRALVETSHQRRTTCCKGQFARQRERSSTRHWTVKDDFMLVCGTHFNAIESRALTKV